MKADKTRCNAGGKMTGPWKSCRENGKPTQTVSFASEKEVCLRKHDRPDRSLYDEGNCLNNRRVGEWRACDVNEKHINTTRRELR